MVDERRQPAAPESEAADPVVSRVRALLDLAAQHKLAELRITAGDFKLSVRSGEHGTPPASRAPAAEMTDDTLVTEDRPADEDEHIVTAPMIGTFYTAPAPGEPAFVNIGDTVEVGQTIAIIEAMKIMNELQSDQTGTVVEILAESGQGVEYGQPLFRLRQDAADA